MIREFMKISFIKVILIKKMYQTIFKKLMVAIFRFKSNKSKLMKLSPSKQQISKTYFINMLAMINIIKLADPYKLNQLNHMSSTLQVTVKYGELNQSFELFGKMQNYVILKLLNGGKQQKQRTKIALGIKNQKIIWNEKFTFEVLQSAHKTAVLQVIIMDKESILADQICGVGQVKLQKQGYFLKNFQGLNQNHPIKLMDQNIAQVNGELNVKIVLK